MTTETRQTPAPMWLWPVAAFTAAFLVNALPHTLMGLTVHRFPTPFSGGPGTLSSPMVNTLWGLSNIVIAAGLLRLMRPWLGRWAVRWTMVVAAFAFAVFLTWAIGSVPLPVSSY